MRPLRETVAAALLWEHESGLGRHRRAGLTPKRERLLLARLEGLCPAVSLRLTR